MDQLLVGAQLGYPAMIQHQDLVGFHQGCDAVGDEDGGALYVLLDGLPDLGVSFHIHSGERVVKDLDGRILHQHPGDGHTLFLSAGDGDAPLADGGIIALGKALDGVVDHSQTGIAADGFQIGSGSALGDAVLKALGEEEGLLQNDADIFSQIRKLDVSDIHPADGDGSVFPRQLIEPVQQVHQGGFSRASSSQNAEGSACLDGKAHIVEDAALALIVAKVHLVEDDVPVHGRLLGILAVFLLLGVQDLKQTGGADRGFAQLSQQPSQVPRGPPQHGGIGGEGQEFSRGQFAPLHKEHASHNDHQHLEAGQEVAQAPVEAHNLAQPDPVVGELFIFFVKAVDFIAFPAEGPHHSDAGEVLLDEGGEPSLALVGGLELFAGDDKEDQVGNDQHRHKAEHQQGKLYIEGEHHHQGYHNEQHGAHHFHQLVADKVADELHVLGATLDDVTGGMSVVPGVGQPLDVGKQRVADPGDGALAGPSQAHAGGIIGEAGDHGKDQGHQSAQHNVLTQCLPAADGVDPIHQKGRQVKGRVVDDGVHGDADDLWCHVVCHHSHNHHDNRQQKFSTESLGEGEKPQDG